MTVIGVDWSGAKGERAHPGIWISAQRGDTLVVDRGGWSRTEAVDFIRAQAPPVVAGFDFSFGIPAWFARELGCRTIEDVWAAAARDGEQWLAPTPPFWRTRCELAPERRFRRCEERLHALGFRPKSVFQLVGNGQVGAGSVRGMPHLVRLRDAGFTIWPFDDASDRLAVEIYPTLLRRRFPEHDASDAPRTDARDARASARVMQTRADELTSLAATPDPIARIEGGVWLPTIVTREQPAAPSGCGPG
jgi:hypothetical protein